MPRVRQPYTDDMAEPSSDSDIPGTDVREHILGADEVQQQTEVEGGIKRAGSDDAPLRMIPTIEIVIDGPVATVHLRNWVPGVSMGAIDRGLHIAMREVQTYSHRLAFRRVGE